MLESLMMGRPGEGSVEPEAPAEIGVFWEGGYYTGMIQVDEKIYALVLAPKAQGESPSSQVWRTTNTETSGAYSLNDGWTNTQAMITAGADLHPAAQYCHNLVINGYDDWYLPSVDELEMCYRAFKPNTTNNFVNDSGGPSGPIGYNPSSIPIGAAYTTKNPGQTNLAIFRSGGSEAFKSSYYWSSTEHSTRAAWRQYFGNSSQNNNDKITPSNIRAIRRVLLN